MVKLLLSYMPAGSVDVGDNEGKQVNTSMCLQVLSCCM